MKHDDFVIAETDFGTFAIPRESAGRWPARTIVNGKRWEPETTDVVCEYAKRGGDVIHAGAFFGDALPALSQAVEFPHVVFAFEPNPMNHAAAARTIELNGLDNILLFEYALGEDDETLLLRTHDTAGEALGSVSRIAADGEEIGVVKIDGKTHGNVAVIHLDLEGWELQALKGAVRTINLYLPVLVLEAWRGADPYLEWCADNVVGAEYRLVREVEGNVILSCEME